MGAVVIVRICLKVRHSRRKCAPLCLLKDVSALRQVGIGARSISLLLLPDGLQPFAESHLEHLLIDQISSLLVKALSLLW